ncbi:MAG: hypothetical protein Q4B94_07950 [Pseudomonadota bacterium]|nr:hypothetical protein [Pseudomonadota bacterium]
MKQTLALLKLFAGIHIARPRDALLLVAGFILAAATLMVLLSIPAGLERIGQGTGHDDIALVSGDTGLGEGSSNITPAQFNLLSVLPQTARDASGKPIASGQLIRTIKLEKADGEKFSIQVRGIDAIGWQLLGGAAIQGDIPKEGRREFLAGYLARQQFPKLASSDRLPIRGRSWRQKGQINHGGNLWDSEIWADLSAMQAAFQAPSSYSVALLKLGQPGDLDALNAAIQADPRLAGLKAHRQSDYYQRQSGWLGRIMTRVAWGVSLLLGAGAALAIGNALGTALERRRREAGTLRALGFANASIALASLAEVLLMAAFTSLAVWGLLYLALNGREFGTSSGNHMIFAQLHLGWQVGLAVLGYTLLLGLLAALLPIRRLSYGKLMDALRAA